MKRRTIVLTALAVAPLRVGAQNARSVDCSVARETVPVTLPVAVRSNHFVIQACRGDRLLTMFLDTGAGVSLFDLTVAESLGIPTTDMMSAGGAGAGRVQGARLRPDSVRLAGTNIQAPVSLALDLQGVSERSGIHIDGILGADFIRRYILALSYHDSTINVMDANGFHYAGPGTTVPFTYRGAFIYVDGALGLSDGGKVPGTFVVDVGAGGALSLAKPFVDANHLRDRAGPTVHRPAGFGVGGMTWGELARAESFSIGDVVVAKPVVTLYGDSAGVFSSSVNGQGNIGGDILRRFTLFLDYPHKQLIFEPNADFAEPFEVDMTGLSLVPVPGQDRAQVLYVVPGSPGAQAGFVAGDTVTAFDGRPASSSELDRTAVKRRTEGQRLTFTVRRRGADVDLVLVTKRLV